MHLRKRRRRTPQKSKSQPELKRRRFKIRFNLKDASIKLLISLFLLADVALICFAVRQCARPKKVAAGRTVPKSEKTEPAVPVKPKREKKNQVVQIEVLNGCGVPRIADRFTAYLRKNNFDVVKTGNYETYGVAKTLVIDRKGNLENAVRVARTLGLPKERALQEKNEGFVVDATVILGSDFRQLDSWKKMEKEHAGSGF